jgi:hypothetical protein
MMRFLIASNIKKEMLLKVKQTAIILNKFVKSAIENLRARKIKRNFLIQAFEREFNTLEEYYKHKSKKNKKLKSTLKLFNAINKKMQDTDEADVDSNA